MFGFGGFSSQGQAAINADVVRSIGHTPIGEWLAEYLYCYSWAAAKLINIPVDDIWRNGRRWVADEKPEEKPGEKPAKPGEKPGEKPAKPGEKPGEKAVDGAVEAMEQEESRLKAHKTLAEAMKAARLFGSAAVVAFIEGQDPAEELDPASVKKGALKTLLVRNRYHLTVDSDVSDPFMENYGKPWRYRVSMPLVEGDMGQGKDPNRGYMGAMSDEIKKGMKDGQVKVHASRIFRFDGHTLPGGGRFSTRTYSMDWGESMLTRLLAALLRDEGTQDAFGDLVKESSIFTIKVDGLNDMIKGRVHRDEPSVEEIARNISKYRNNYRTLFLDAGAEAERIAVAFSGAADMMDRFATRLAMIADIPATRFLAKAPDGMNATGHGDNANYLLTLTSMRQDMLEDLLPRFDELLAASAGIGEPPEYEWEDTFSADPDSVAKNAEVQSRSVFSALSSGAITVSEAREILPETWFGSLGPMPAELKRMEEMAGEKEQAELDNMLSEGDDDDGPPSKGSGGPPKSGGAPKKSAGPPNGKDKPK